MKLKSLLFTVLIAVVDLIPMYVEANNLERIRHIEPLSWWIGMQTPLQLMIHGEDISSFSVAVEGKKRGVEIKSVHPAESPNYLFVDVEIAPTAKAGTYHFVLTRGKERIIVPYQIAARRSGSRERCSFSSADVIYLFMPDRFANGDESNDSTSDTAEKANRADLGGRHGGDIQGVMDHLDYLADLGVTALWSTPMLLDNEPAYSYHGYACADYYHIDPRYGSNELYRNYVDESHKRGLKVIMDIVTNHCGMAHWWMQDLPFRDWIHHFTEYTQTNNFFSTNMDPNASQYDLKIQEQGWFDRSMPDMNLDNSYLLQYFKQWAVWWIEYANLDGLRVDTYPYNEKQPMSEWCQSVRTEYPNLNIVGECWTSSVPQLAYWQADNKNHDGFDSHLPSIMDFPLYNAICAALPSDSTRWGEGMTKVYEAMSHDFVYRDVQNMMIFVGNHDTDRIGDLVRKSPDRMKIALTLLATMRGIPQIFAGDEMMFCSKDVSQGHSGLRIDFEGGWAEDTHNLFIDEGRNSQQRDLHDFTAKLFNWRRHKQVIHTGKTLHFGSRDNTYAFFRYNDTEAVFVYVNNSRGTKHIPWSHYSELGNSLYDGRNILTDEPVEMSDTVTVKPRSVMIVEFNRR